MDALQIKALIEAMAASGLAEMEASKDGWTLRLVRDAALPASRPAAAASVTAARDAQVQRAALCGVVFLQPAPGEPPFVQQGQAVKAGQVLCVIEAMKVFNEILAERDGIVEEILVASGQDVDADQPLVRLR